MKKTISIIALLCMALTLSALISFDVHAQDTETPTPTASETPTLTPTATDTPVPVLTDTPTPIATEEIPPYHFDGTVTYGDYIQIILISLLCVAIGLFGTVGLVVNIIIKSKR